MRRQGVVVRRTRFQHQQLVHPSLRLNLMARGMHHCLQVLAVLAPIYFKHFEAKRVLMGQGSSTQQAAVDHSSKGWPAFMWGTDLRKLLNKYRAQKSLLGSRMRLIDSRNGCIEYVKVVDTRTNRLYQRVDGPCGSGTRPLAFPLALPRLTFERPSYVGELHPVVLRATYAEVVNPRTRRCATYRLYDNGVWMKQGDKCSDARLEWHIMREKRWWRRKAEDAEHDAVLGGSQAPKESNTMREFMAQCPADDCKAVNPRRLPPYAGGPLDQRINPAFDCTYADPYFSPGCQALLRHAGKVDKVSMRRREDAKRYGVTSSGRGVINVRT